MPTIFTPPVLDPRPHIGEGDNGGRRRPPVDKFTGGNGEGDNWSDRPPGQRGPRERLSQARVGISLALGCDALFFIGLIVAYLVTRSNQNFDVHGNIVSTWLPIAIPRILLANTAVLLLSAATAEIARRSMFRETDVMDEWIGLGRPTSKRATLWLSITLALGTIFLAGQAFAWHQLSAMPAFYLANSSSKLFYIFTIMHAIHLVLGIGALIVSLTALSKSRVFATRQVFVDTTVWYWHAMGVLWVLLYLLLEFFQ